MSENRLGGVIQLTVPQLRVYLSCMRRMADMYERGGSKNPEDGTIYANHCQAFGINEAVEELLKCLNLPPDWEGKMDRLEASEVSAGMTSEEWAEFRKVAP